MVWWLRVLRRQLQTSRARSRSATDSYNLLNSSSKSHKPMDTFSNNKFNSNRYNSNKCSNSKFNSNSRYSSNSNSSNSSTSTNRRWWVSSSNSTISRPSNSRCSKWRYNRNRLLYNNNKCWRSSSIMRRPNRHNNSGWDRYRKINNSSKLLVNRPRQQWWPARTTKRNKLCSSSK